MENSAIVIKTDGRISTKKKEELIQLKKKFNLVNNQIGGIMQEQDDLNSELKKLKQEKRELTRKVDEKMKMKKLRMKQLKEQAMFVLGERNARIKDLKELGATIETGEKQGAKNKAVELEEAKVLEG